MSVLVNDSNFQQKILIKKLRDAASEGAADGCEIKDWREAVVGLKKSCAEYRSGTKQEGGVSKLNLRDANL